MAPIFQELFTSKWIESVLETPPTSNFDKMAQLTQVIIDSRSAQLGDFFVALKGETFDGHDFINSALESGVKGFLVQKGRKTNWPKGVLVFQVPSTLEAYRKLAAEWRGQFNIPVYAIAGSVGKTTTKEFLASLLCDKFKNVLHTQKSENGFIGIPKTLLNLRSEHQVAVIEIGIDEIGAMQKHLELVKPNYGVVTAITEEHLEKLIDLDHVTREESSILSWIHTNNGKVVINLDEPRLIAKRNMVLDDSLSKGGLGYTLYEAPSRHVLHGEFDLENKSIEVTGGPYQGEKFNLPLLGEHNASNLLSAIALSVLCEVTPKQALKGIQKFQAPFGRSEIKTTEKGVVIIGDHYNSSPSAVRAALILLGDLSETQKKAKKWVCLGDMLELGKDEEIFHRRLSLPLIAQDIDTVLLYGEKMKWLLEELTTNDRYQGTVKHFPTHKSLYEYLSKNINSNDIILIKGSRGMQMEKIIDKLIS